MQTSAIINPRSIGRSALLKVGAIQERAAKAVWTPQPGPQTQAMNSDADIIGFGGSAGGGKSDTLLGMAFTQAKKAIIFRPHFTDLVDIVTRGDQIMDGACSFVWGVKRRWDTPDGRQVELGAIEHTKDQVKYRGRPHDFIGIDEAADFSESIFRFVTGWLRSSTGQRTRIMLTFNPPSNAEGEWIIRYFAPWLDGKHANPAQPGELRWFIYADNQDIEVDGSAIVDYKGQQYTPKSRTFIPARLSDNAFIGDDYVATLQSLPEPLRSQLLFGDFNATAEDDRWQVIPTAWVRAAMKRWHDTEADLELKARSIGFDVARGGKDKSVVARLTGNRFELFSAPGKETADGPSAAKFVADYAENDTPIAVDVIGIGASAYDSLLALNFESVSPINNGSSSEHTDNSGRYRFTNLRAQSYWKLREALDPASGEDIALPDDRELLADLCAARYELSGAKIKLEEKDHIRQRIGRSPDKSDAVVMAYHIANSSPLMSWVAF